MGERYTGSVEVMGSSPTVSTLSLIKEIRGKPDFFFWRFNGGETGEKEYVQMQKICSMGACDRDDAGRFRL